MRLIPMQFNPPDSAVRESNPRYTFQFSPATTPINFLQISQIVNTCSNRNNFYFFNRTDDFKLHMY